MSSSRELKSPFIDTFASEDLDHSAISSLLLHNSNNSISQAVKIKESLDEIKAYLSSVIPSTKKLGHATISSIYYNSKDQLICLCVDGNLVSFFLTKNEKIELKPEIKLERIYYTKDDNFFVGSSQKFVLVFNSFSLKTLKKVEVFGMIGSCEFLPFEQIFFNKTEIFTLSLKSFEIQSCARFDRILNVNFLKDKLLVVLDKDSVKILSKKFKVVNEMILENPKMCKLSESLDKIVVKLVKSFLIFNEKLEVLKEFRMEFDITDFIYEDSYQIMIVSTAKGDLIFCDIRIPSRKIPIKVHKMSIPNIFLQHNKVLSVSEDLQITQTKIPKLKNTYIKESKIISLSTSTNPCKFYYISTSFEVFSWNFKENLTLLLYKNETLNPVLLFHDEKLYLTSQSEMISINLHTSKIRTEPKAFNQKFFSMILIHPDLLACAGQSNSIFLFSLNTLQLVSELVAHGQRVTCLSSYYQVMVSGSMDKTLKVWNMVDRSLLHVLHGHSKPISEVLVDKGKIFSASQDRSLRVWYVKTGELIHLIHSISGIIKFMFLTSEFLLTCNNFGVLTYWNLTTYAKVMSNSLYGPIIQFRANEDTIIYCSDSFLVTFLNPLKGKKLVITGPKEADQFKTYKYLKKILNHKSVSFNPTCDKWVIFPYILTPLHLYAYFNMPGHVRDSLQNNTSLVQSRLKLSPLSIAVSRDLESCVSSIIKLIKPKLAENPYLLNFIDDQCLIEMNWTGHDSLALFYKVFFQEVTTEALPRFIKHEVKLPIYAKSVGMIPKSQSFIQDAKKSDIGQAVVFQRSLGKLSLAMGSKPSIKLLRSIVECKNYEIFDTPFIRAYIQHKWESVKLFMWLQFLIYFSYMVYFCLYLMQIYSNVIFLVIPLILSCVLTFYEIYKAVVSGYEYFLVVWNYLDAARAMLFLVFFYQQWKEGHDSSINDDDGETDYVLLILVMVSFIKGLSYFRLFHYTRHFIHLLFQVLIDSYAFVVILAYNTVAFGFILLVAFSFQHDLGFYMSLSFQINLAINDPSEYTPTQWVVYSLGIAINNLVMMSVLISLYGETFDNVQKVAEIENTRTLADMSLEAERNIFWRRGKTRKSYLQMCSKGKWNSENDPAVEKVKSLKRIAKDNKDEIRLVKDEILDTIKKQRIRDKAKKAGIKHQDLALRLFKMLFVEFGNNRIEKEKVVKKVEKIIRVLV